jgi:hypothetical protein
MLFSPAIANNCFGNNARDIGQRRVPEPPERITGWIFGMSVSHVPGLTVPPRGFRF